ncbi:polysaccharide polymerase [Streptococcus danieliae]|uniref:Polysaccharide polymerase n=1 Tax=Streptococcus danieliae TaxID=747656 RepID=A0A7Z0M6V0_9STRE|nr:polysaccharide polymerase [Streptococcus danieliae]MBF0699722.1 polysaccharide polymerase [Streptococcus danieliae]NYS96898.1 polysaccharide polymerase [Streptococcus danieliae]
MLKIDFDKLLIGVVLTFVIGWDFFGTTMLARELPTIPSAIVLCATWILALRFIYIQKFELNFLIFAPLLLLAGMAVAWKMRNINFLIYMSLIVLLYKADIDYALKIFVTITGLMLVTTVFLSLIDVIPNLQFVQNRARGVVTRNSLGFIYPTDFASHCFYFFAALSYVLREKYIVFRTGLGLAIGAILYFVADARLNAYSTLVSVLLFLIFYFKKDLNSRVFRFSPLAAPIAAGLMYYWTSHFNWGDGRYIALNNFFSMRLALGRQAMNTYSINYFGTPGTQFRGYGGTTETVLNYTYVDSSYIQMLFYYGSLSVLLLILFYFIQSIRILQKKQYLLLCLLCLIAVNCMIEAFWIRPSYNIFMFVLMGVGSEFIKGGQDEADKELSL